MIKIEEISEDWIDHLATDNWINVRLAADRYCRAFADWVESPIELKFLAAWLVATTTADWNPQVVRSSKFLERCKEYDLVITPQWIWRTYRSDFCIGGKLLTKLILIECDGHDFHERTKEQAIWDRDRDAKAQMDGYAILRFTGSQIHRKPLECMISICNFINSLQQKAG